MKSKGNSEIYLRWVLPSARSYTR